MAESSGNKLQSYVTALVEELKKSTVKDREATLTTLKKIFDNIIQHPNDDKYRQIKLSDKRFSSKHRKKTYEKRLEIYTVFVAVSNETATLTLWPLVIATAAVCTAVGSLA